MTPKEALEMLKSCGTNTEEPYESKIIDVLEKLVERDTPIKSKIIFGRFCSVCGSTLVIPQLIEVNFCPKCGQRIDWSE